MAAIVPALAVRLLLAHRDTDLRAGRPRRQAHRRACKATRSASTRCSRSTISPLDYEFVPMSFDPQPLVDGEMDVITCYVTNQPIQLRMQGHDVSRRHVQRLRPDDVRRRDLRVPGVARRRTATSPCATSRGLIAGADANRRRPRLDDPDPDRQLRSGCRDRRGVRDSGERRVHQADGQRLHRRQRAARRSISTSCATRCTPRTRRRARPTCPTSTRCSTPRSPSTPASRWWFRHP